MIRKKRNRTIQITRTARLCITGFPFMLFLYYSQQFKAASFLVSSFYHSPCVSIVVPLYNKGEYLKRSIPSALNQSLKDIEILIIDDHSTDDSVKIAKKYVKSDKRVHLVELEQNVGTFTVRLICGQKATGEFILSLDPDDSLSPDVALVDYETSLITGADIVEHQIMQIFPDGSQKPLKWKYPRFLEADQKRMQDDFVIGKLNWNLPRKIIRRTVYLAAIELIGVEFFKKRLTYGEDKLIMGAVYCIAKKHVVIDFVGYYYFVDLPDSSKKLYKIRNRIKQLRFHINPKLSKIYNKSMANDFM